jgi:hypothetical protein
MELMTGSVSVEIGTRRDLNVVKDVVVGATGGVANASLFDVDGGELGLFGVLICMSYVPSSEF